MKPKFKKGQFVNAVVPQLDDKKIPGEIINSFELAGKIVYEIYFDVLPEGKTYFIDEENISKTALDFNDIMTIIVIAIALYFISQCLK